MFCSAQMRSGASQGLYFSRGSVPGPRWGLRPGPPMSANPVLGTLRMPRSQNSPECGNNLPKNSELDPPLDLPINY